VVSTRHVGIYESLLQYGFTEFGEQDDIARIRVGDAFVTWFDNAGLRPRDCRYVTNVLEPGVFVVKTDSEARDGEPGQVLMAHPRAGYDKAKRLWSADRTTYQWVVPEMATGQPVGRYRRERRWARYANHENDMWPESVIFPLCQDHRNGYFQSYCCSWEPIPGTSRTFRETMLKHGVVDIERLLRMHGSAAVTLYLEKCLAKQGVCCECTAQAHQ
jgi:hypothetical protein